MDGVLHEFGDGFKAGKTKKGKYVIRVQTQSSLDASVSMSSSARC